MSRKRAFLTHLAMSAAAVGLVCSLIFFVWYPDPYFHAMGAWGVLRVLISVDLVVGPLMTLIVFKPGKRGLVFDLWVIAIVQLSALLYGATTIYRERPYFTVFAIDRFSVLPLADIDPAGLAAPDLTERIGVKPFIGPRLVVASRPSDDAAMQRLIEDLFAGKPDIERRPEFWDDYARHTDQVIARARPLPKLIEQRPATEAQVRAVAAAHGIELERLGLLPLMAKNTDMSVIIDLEDGSLVDVIDLDPWDH